MEQTPNPPDPVALAQQAVRVGRLVREAMEKAEMTQRDLAAASGLSLAKLNRRLFGSPFTITELDSVCRALGTKASDLIAEAEAAA